MLRQTTLFQTYYHGFSDLVASSVDDVDLYSAGVVEEHVSGGMVGPTFACIIAKQFRNLRVGDRFWYERPDQYIGFTPGTYKYEYVHTVCGTIGIHQFGRNSITTCTADYC